MATRHQQQQPLNSNNNNNSSSSRSKNMQFARLPLDPSLMSESELALEELCREPVASPSQEFELELEERDLHADIETRNEQDEALSMLTQRQTQDYSLHLHSEMERDHLASAGHFPKDPEGSSLPSVSTLQSNPDLLASMDVMGSFGSFPSKQVEGTLQSCLTSAEGQVTRLLHQSMDTVQSQVLRSLHQAAGDIIEHVSKEAARRVVVAERKATLLELELSSVKQQALSMLLRVKADSDAQALDAEKKYLLERRRAQDAEAKLAIAQDTLKRFKSELKKKGDILDKMQKLVQPMTEGYSHNPSGSAELTGNLESSVKGMNNRHRKSPACSVEGTSIMMCSAALQDEVHCLEVQPNMEAVLQAVDGCNEKQSSLSSKTCAVEEDSLPLRKQACFSNGTLHNNQGSASLHEEEFFPRKTDAGGGDFLVNCLVELSGHVEGSRSHEVDYPKANLGEEDKRIEQMPNTQLLPPTEGDDEKLNSAPTACQRSVDGKEFVQGSSAAVKGFYVRRKLRENGKMQEKKDLSMEHSLNVVTELDLKADSLLRSSNETAAKLKTDTSEGECRTCSSRRDSQVFFHATDSSGRLGHVVQDLASDLPEELSSSDTSKGVDLGSSTTRNELVTETVKFARPDYEVATSLAELASIGLEVRSQEMESFPHMVTKEGIFLKPGRTGLRMKRKGISFERKVTQQSDGKVSKKPRPEKLVSVLTDSHAERVLRRNRGGKYSILKDNLSLESSRDNRRLMQGARQLLCLAEKKW
ncbi:hypothetical protein L7F22_038784 [Adiantum nelumboides]|nr:hypothetical protein [Adiantum nelumboides]